MSGSLFWLCFQRLRLLPESRLFEASRRQEFQELAVVWHEAWKKPEKKTKGGKGGEGRGGEGGEVGRSDRSAARNDEGVERRWRRSPKRKGKGGEKGVGVEVGLVRKEISPKIKTNK